MLMYTMLALQHFLDPKMRQSAGLFPEGENICFLGKFFSPRGLLSKLNIKSGVLVIQNFFK